MNEVTNAFPPYMDKGSEGPHVDTHIDGLVQLGYGEGLIANQVYGDMTAARTMDYQKAKGIEADGNNGPQTREAMKADGFDFEAECHKTPGTTRFLQPNSTYLIWTSPAGTEPAAADSPTTTRRPGHFGIEDGRNPNDDHTGG